MLLSSAPSSCKLHLSDEVASGGKPGKVGPDGGHAPPVYVPSRKERPGTGGVEWGVKAYRHSGAYHAWQVARGVPAKTRASSRGEMRSFMSLSLAPSHIFSGGGYVPRSPAFRRPTSVAWICVRPPVRNDRSPSVASSVLGCLALGGHPQFRRVSQGACTRICRFQAAKSAHGTRKGCRRLPKLLEGAVGLSASTLAPRSE